MACSCVLAVNTLDTTTIRTATLCVTLSGIPAVPYSIGHGVLFGRWVLGAGFVFPCILLVNVKGKAIHSRSPCFRFSCILLRFVVSPASLASLIVLAHATILPALLRSIVHWSLNGGQQVCPKRSMQQQYNGYIMEPTVSLDGYLGRPQFVARFVDTAL